MKIYRFIYYIYRVFIESFGRSLRKESCGFQVKVGGFQVKVMCCMCQRLQLRNICRLEGFVPYSSTEKRSTSRTSLGRLESFDHVKCLACHHEPVLHTQLDDTVFGNNALIYISYTITVIPVVLQPVLENVYDLHTRTNTLVL